MLGRRLYVDAFLAVQVQQEGRMMRKIIAGTVPAFEWTCRGISTCSVHADFCVVGIWRRHAFCNGQGYSSAGLLAVYGEHCPSQCRGMALVILLLMCGMFALSWAAAELAKEASGFV